MRFTMIRLLYLLSLILLALPLHTISTRTEACTSFVNGAFRRPKRTVRCNHGNLTRVPQRNSKLDTVSELLLDDNRIARLDEHSFYSWRDLEHLSLRNNRIFKIAILTFAPLRKLRRLNLGGNRLRLPDSFPPMALAHLTELRELDLSFNPLEVVPPYHFQVLGNLRVLTLRGTRPSLKLSDNAFAGMRRAHSIDLTSNYLSTLPETAFKDTQSLTSLQLGGSNPWKCDCNLRWLKVWHNQRIHTRPYIDSSDDEMTALQPSCSLPDRLKGRDLFDPKIYPGEFQCAPKIWQRPDSRLVLSFTGYNVSLVCHVIANPLAGIDWFKDGQRVSLAYVNRPFVKSRSPVGPRAEFKAQLHLPSVRESDAGDWACMAWNLEGQAVQSYDVRIVPKCSPNILQSGLLGVGALIAWSVLLLGIGLFCFYNLRKRQQRRLSVRRAKEGEAACNLYQEEKL